MDVDRTLAMLRETFAQDLAEHVARLNDDLVAIEHTPAGADYRALVDRIFRAAHGLKGGARGANLPAVETLCHDMESLLHAVRRDARALTPDEVSRLLAGVDQLAQAGRALAPTSPVDGPRGSSTPAERVPVDRTQTVTTPASDPPTGQDRIQAAPDTFRVTRDRLDALGASGAELGMNADRLAARSARLDRLARSARRTHQALRTARPAHETIDAVRALDRDAQRLAAQARHEAMELRNAARRLDAGVRELRLVPWQDACTGLRRMVRDMTEDTEHEAEVVVHGGGLELDQTLIERLRDPLVALVRNAVAHGIEPASTRVAAGKPPRGRIDVGARLSGEHVEVWIADDGAGIDVERVVAKAGRLGLALPPDPVRRLDLIFAPGLSTHESAGAVSGRGVGLDIVAQAVSDLHGTVEVSSTPKRGTRFDLRLPARASSLRCLLVAAEAHTYAIPAVEVDRVERIDAGRIRAVGERRVVLVDDAALPFARLGDLLERRNATNVESGMVLVLVIEWLGQVVAVAVDEVQSEQQLAVEPLGSRWQGLRYASGVTDLPSQRLALVLSVPELVAAAATAASPALKAPVPVRPRRVLLADDALTTRTLERLLLESAGYEVITAVDGRDAWTRLREARVDVVVSDVEMPNMDGFELVRAIRASDTHARLPVVLVTGLASEADRHRGLDAGADAYVVKSAFDQRELVQTIERLVRRDRTAPRHAPPTPERA